MTTITRQEARRRVAEIQGWTIKEEGRYSWVLSKGRKFVRSELCEDDAWEAIPDPFDLGNAARLRWELPKIWRWADHYGYIEIHKGHGIGDECFIYNGPEEFSVACVCAYLTAHDGERVEIKEDGNGN